MRQSRLVWRTLAVLIGLIAPPAVIGGEPSANGTADGKAQATREPGKASWPMWGGTPDRNAVGPDTGLPREWDLESKRHVKWSRRLGSYSYGGPVVVGGRVFVGTNNARELRSHSKGDKGVVLCLDAASGKLLWQATHDKLESGSVHDWPDQGVASTPYVDGDRIYYVSNRAELVCADVAGFHDGRNDGPYKSEKFQHKQDADFVWVLDMIKELGVFPHNLAACAPVGSDELVFVCTSNGVAEDHEHVPAPEAPSFVAVEKKTGKVRWQRNDPGRGILHGQWSSPAYAVIEGQAQVIFGGGDGWCYSFAADDGEFLWKFDLNPPGSEWRRSGTGDKTSIVATPVVQGETVYLAVGDDPEAADGPGHLYAIDATRRGDITNSGKRWHFGGEAFGRTIASVVVAAGLVYAVDLNGYLSCLDAKSGKRLWQQDMEAAVWASPAVLGDRVYLGNADGDLFVLAHGRENKLLAQHNMRYPIYTPVVGVDGVLYVMTQRTLHALHDPGRAGRTPDDAWPVFRGNRLQTGVAGSELAGRLKQVWQHDAQEPIVSTPAIVDREVYVGTDDGTLLSLSLADGAERWKHAVDAPIESSPSVAGALVVFGDDAGVMHALAREDGKPRWSFATEGRIVSSLMVYDGLGVFGSYDGGLYALDVGTGKQRWKYTIEERIHATPAIADDKVLIAGCDGRLHVVQLADGQRVRSVALESVTGCSPAVSGARAFLGTYGDDVLSVDWRAGTVVWRFSDQEQPMPFMSSAALARGLMIVGGRDKRVRAFYQGGGVVRWAFEARGRVDCSPVVSGDYVYVGCTSGVLYALDIERGREVWRFETGSAIVGSPAVAAGRLVVGTEDGMIYAFESQAPSREGQSSQEEAVVPES